MGLDFGLSMLMWLIFGTVINACFLKISIKVICKRRYPLIDACSVSIKVVLGVAAIQMVFWLIGMYTPEFLHILLLLLYFIASFILSAVINARFINSRRGLPIGLKRGILIQLIQTALYIATMIPFFILGILIGMSTTPTPVV